MLHRASKRLRVVLLALWILGAWLWLARVSSSRPSSRSGLSNTGAVHISEHQTLKDHPIQALVRTAETDFERLLARQSQAFEEAASEYVRRYQRQPPPGFENWYGFAASHNSPIIDEFDVINETLAPFWSLSGAEVKRRLSHVRRNGWAIDHCGVRDGRLTPGCESLGEELLALLKDTDVVTNIAELDMLINVLDEPRVLTSPTATANGGLDSEGDLTRTDNSHSRVWEKLLAACGYPYDSEFNRKFDGERQARRMSLNFANQSSDTRDLCQHPEYEHMHGLWDSPVNFNTIDLALPILSSAVLSTMGDVPIPAAVYTSSAFTYDEAEDFPWADKSAGLYWAGKTTGSLQGANVEDWKQHHRQRFVTMANNTSSEPHLYLKTSEDGPRWQQHISILRNGPLYNVYFTDVVQTIDNETEAAVRQHFSIHEPDSREEAFKYTLTFDLDGNGHSGRFYRLLNSRSLPLKQTVLREWHDERLQPWLHYVPISLGMEELPEVVRYLSSEHEGREIAAMIAEKGRLWSSRAMRPVDQAIYLYRLMLELARLQDPGRPASQH